MNAAAAAAAKRRAKKKQRVTEEMSFPDVAVALLQEQAAQMAAHKAGTISGKDPEDLHDLRVATRRARSALRLFMPLAAGEALKVVRKELSWIGGILGDVRNLDVFLLNLRKQLDRASTGPDEQRTLITAAEQMREPCHARMVKALGSARFERILVVLQDETTLRTPLLAQAEMTAREVGWEIIHAALEEVMSKSKGDVARYPYDKLHRIRIALKRLRYACEFFTNVFAGGLRKQIKRVVRYQDCLGEMQDALVARRIMQYLVDRLVADGHGTPTVLIAAGAMMQLQLETAEARREKFCATWDKFPKVTNRIEKALTERDG